MPLDQVNSTAVTSIGQQPAAESEILLHTMPQYQRTLAGDIQFTSVGVHTGEQVAMRIRPAAPNSGVTFVRTDITDRDNAIRPHPVTGHINNVCNTRLCTMLGNTAGTTVSTVEHLMSVLYALGVDNAVVELNGPEVPVGDGSAEPFLHLLLKTGLVTQAAGRKAIQILRKINVEHKGRTVTLEPNDETVLEAVVDYTGKNDAIGFQARRFVLTPAAFMQDIAPARTFCLEGDIELMREQGLAKGGSLDNAVVYTGNADKPVLNPEGKRFDDEAVRHKILDKVGDMALVGGVVLGLMRSHLPGHDMSYRAFMEMFADEANYRLANLPLERMEPTQEFIGLPIYCGATARPA
ncbi:MAG: UDP-3-O-acyl-N-acetylglucosamine deacetylase [Bdellovibrionales bacterium]